MARQLVTEMGVGTMLAPQNQLEAARLAREQMNKEMHENAL
jgi:hypothetical protein